MITVFTITLILFTTTLAVQEVYGEEDLPLSIPFGGTGSEKSIPDWVDQNFRWYGEGAISQSELVNAIKFLIDEEIMIIDTPTASSGDFLQSDLAEKGIVIVDSIPSDLAAKGIIIVDFMPDQRADSSLRDELEARGIVIIDSMPSDLEAKGIIIIDVMPSDSIRSDLEAKGIIIIDAMPSDVTEKGIIVITGSPSELAAKGIIINTMSGFSDMGFKYIPPYSSTSSGGQGEIIIVGGFAAQSDFASKTIGDILTNGGTESIWEDGIASFSDQGLRESVIPELQGIVVLCNNEIDKKTQSIDAELKILEMWLDIISKEQESSSYDASGRLTSDTTESTVQYRESDFDFISRSLGSIEQQIKALDTGIEVLEGKLSSVGDDAQLANIDLQNSLQKQQQTLQTMSNILKSQHDTLKAIINNVR